MKPVCYWMVAGSAACVVLQAAGFKAFGLCALVLAAIGGMSSWPLDKSSS